MRRFIPTLAFVVLVAGCASSTPQYDARFGDAVRQARQSMVLYAQPAAASIPAGTLDGKIAREAADRYHDTYKAPPRVVNVINIGGSVGGGAGGGQ